MEIFGFEIPDINWAIFSVVYVFLLICVWVVADMIAETSLMNKIIYTIVGFIMTYFIVMFQVKN